MKELSFKTNARHIGQLGRELVTDFVTALVELIKNSYDADAAGAQISIADAKKVSGRITLTDCGDGMTIEDFEEKWMVIGTSNKLSNPYTPKGRKKAGKKGIGRFSVERLAERVSIYSFPKDSTAFCVKIDWNRFEELDLLALRQRIEILRNRKDKEAAKFVAYQMQYVLLHPDLIETDRSAILGLLGSEYKSYILYFDQLILDSLSDSIIPLIKKYEGKRQLIEDIKSPLTTIDDVEACPEYERVKQLGEETIRRTALSEIKRANPDATEEEVAALALELAKSRFPEHYSGLVLVLDGLRDEWAQKDITKLEKELRLLVAPDFLEVDPFYINLSAPEFKVEDSASVNSIIGSSFASLNARVYNNGKSYDIHYADITGGKLSRTRDFEEPLECGDFTFELFYFLRDSEHMQRSGYNYRYAIRVLDTYCGIKIYRDMFRVKPYGDLGNDWLFLDKEKVSDTHGYLVGNNQTIGRINISDINNPLLTDATNREGIIENAAFEQLRDFVKECIGLITQARKDAYENSEPERQRQKLEKERKRLQQKQRDIARENEEVKLLVTQMGETIKDWRSTPSGQKATELMGKLLQYHDNQQKYHAEYESNAEQRYNLLQSTLEYTESELAMYKNLATLGMLASEFGHETSDIVNRVGNSIHAVVRDIRTVPEFSESVDILNIVKKDFRRISSYSEMIIAFLRKKKREKREKLIVADVVKEICTYYQDILNEFNIDLTYDCEPGLMLIMRQVDLESIVINMITNAYAQLKTCHERKMHIRAWRENDAIRLRFDDSGPGVPEDKREVIFKAFVSTKEDGVGLGLNIVKDIVTSYKGTIHYEESTVFCGACFAIDFITGDDINGPEGTVH